MEYLNNKENDLINNIVESIVLKLNIKYPLSNIEYKKINQGKRFIIKQTKAIEGTCDEYQIFDTILNKNIINIIYKTKDEYCEIEIFNSNNLNDNFKSCLVIKNYLSKEYEIEIKQPLLINDSNYENNDKITNLDALIELIYEITIASINKFKEK